MEMSQNYDIQIPMETINAFQKQILFHCLDSDIFSCGLWQFCKPWETKQTIRPWSPNLPRSRHYHSLFFLALLCATNLDLVWYKMTIFKSFVTPEKYSRQRTARLVHRPTIRLGHLASRDHGSIVSITLKTFPYSVSKLVTSQLLS